MGENVAVYRVAALFELDAAAPNTAGCVALALAVADMVDAVVVLTLVGS